MFEARERVSPRTVVVAVVVINNIKLVASVDVDQQSHMITHLTRILAPGLGLCKIFWPGKLLGNLQGPFAGQ
jgi:hypothetical protein